MRDKVATYLDKPVVPILLIVSLCLMVYSNTFPVPFVFDDEPSIVRNPVIQDLDNFLVTTSGYQYNPRRFIGYLTFAVNYRLGGLEVTGYHIFNLAVHVINALLVYVLLLMTFRTPALRHSPLVPYAGSIALFTAVFFAVHPLQTGAVTYIVQRVTSLATMFYLSALVLYGRARLLLESGGPLRRRIVVPYLLALLASVLAMTTKEISFTLPFMVVLYELFFFRGPARKRLVFLAPILLTLFIIPLSLITVSQPLGESLSDVSEVTRVQSDVSRGDYLMTQFTVITTYLRLLVLPVRQNLDYDYPIYHSLLTPAVLFSFLALVSLVVLGVYAWHVSKRTDTAAGAEYRLVSFGIFWFFIGLSVESSFIPIADVIFEHRVYLPSIGFFIALITTAMILLNRLQRRKSRAGKAVIPLLTVAVVLLAATTFARNTVWLDDVGLWEDVVRKSPGKARPHYNLGLLYEKQDRFAEAMQEYQTALRLDPYYSLAHNNLGNLYGRQGRFAEAMREFQIVFRLEPRDPTAHVNMGILHATLGRRDAAIREFQTAIQLEPDDAAAHFSLARALSDRGDVAEAMEEYATAVRLKPDYTDAHVNLGVLYGQQGMLDKAIEHFEKALELSPDDPAARFNLRNAYRQKSMQR